MVAGRGRGLVTSIGVWSLSLLSSRAHEGLSSPRGLGGGWVGSFVPLDKTLSASVALNKVSINSSRAMPARSTKRPTQCPGPPTSLQTNGGRIHQAGIVRSVSLHTFTYLSAYSGPVRQGKANMERSAGQAASPGQLGPQGGTMAHGWAQEGPLLESLKSQRMGSKSIVGHF